jgi:chemotaxis protein histidine kinase CheA
MSPEHCLKLLEEDLKKKHIVSDVLDTPRSSTYLELVDLLQELSALPSWGNGRDMKTLSKKIIGKVYKTKQSGGQLDVPSAYLLDAFRNLLNERSARDGASSKGTFNPVTSSNFIQQLPPAPTAPTPPSTNFNTATATKMAPPKTKEEPPPPAKKTEVIDSEEEDVERDQGVSDAIWQQLQADRKAEEQRLQKVAEELRQREESIATMKKMEEKKRKLMEELAAKMAEEEAEQRRIEEAWLAEKTEEEKRIQELVEERREKKQKEFEERQRKHAEEFAARKARADEEKRKLEAARLAEQKVRLARAKAKADLEKRQREEAEKRKKEAQVQQKLRCIGLCVAGFRWIPQASGYRCAGGTHFVDNAALGI